MELNFLAGLIFGALAMLFSASLGYATATIQKREQKKESLIVDVDITVNSEPALNELDKINAKLEEVIALQGKVK